MSFVNKISSLEDKASAQVAINLCEDNGFKEVALCLEKPTYGGFIPYKRSDFVSDPEKLSIWATMKKDDYSLDVFSKSCYVNVKKRVEQWDAAVDEECERLTEGLPRVLREGVHVWINRIALEYLSYSRRQEELFGVVRYFLMNIFTRGDWKESGRLDEKKLAQRLLEDERLTVIQRYRIACAYCLHVHIPRLWKRLTKKEKRSVRGNGKPYLSRESHCLVLLWSYHMDRPREEKGTTNHLWTHAAQNAVRYGNLTALMLCWKMLQENIRLQIVIDMALQSLQQWQSFGKKSYRYEYYKQTLLLKALHSSQWSQSADSVIILNLPSYYSELMRFFLLEMDEEQQLTFFKKAFHRRSCYSRLECFLDWPHQAFFLPTINRLWGIVPKNEYGQCLLTLASKYSGDYDKENRYYDYRTLLWTLWEETPEEYKRYVFVDKRSESNFILPINEGQVLLPRLLQRSPFQEKDEALFKRVFRHQPQEERRVMMHSKVGENICSILVQKEKWSFVNWFLEECLPKEEIPSFKKEFMQSDSGVKLCLDKLKENREKFVEDLIDWSLELDTEKTQFKYELLSRDDCFDVCKIFLRKGKFTEVERMVNFCVSSDEMKEGFKARFAEHTCSALLEDFASGPFLKDCVYKLMDTILAWSVDAEEKISDLRKVIFSNKGVDIHYKLVFFRSDWEEVECFYKWFGLLPEEIRKFKKDTIFSRQVIEHIHQALPKSTHSLVASVRWCLIDKEMVIDLKKEVEEQCLKNLLDERGEKGKEWLDYLVRKLLYGFRKKVQNKTSSKSVFVKGKGNKRSCVVIEDESSSPRKRCKSGSQK